MVGAHAQSLPCDPEAEPLVAALAQLPRCSTEQPFMQRIGIRLSRAERYQEAADIFELMLMRDPQNATAQVEYALALYGLGNATAAQELIDALQAQGQLISHAPPETLAALDAKILANPRPKPGLIPKPKLQIDVMAGYDNNILGMPRSSTIELTLPTTRIPVTLTDTYPERGSAFVQLSANQEGVAAIASQGHLHYGWHVLHKAPDYTPARTTLAGAGLGFVPASHPWLLAQGAWQATQRNGDLVETREKLALGIQGQGEALTKCVPQARLETERTRYPQQPTHDGRYTGVVLQGTCREGRWNIQLNAGRDRADADRPGGDRQQTGLRLDYSHPLPHATWVGKLEWQRNRDATGYSLLLENNSPRKMDIYNLALEYRWKTPFGAPYLALEWLEQRANLPIFNIRNLIAGVGIRGRW